MYLISNKRKQTFYSFDGSALRHFFQALLQMVMTLFNNPQLTKEHAKEALTLWAEQFYGKKLLVCKRISVCMSRKSEFRLLFLPGLSHWLACVSWFLWFLKPHISSSLGGSCSWAQMETANLSLFDLIASRSWGSDATCEGAPEWSVPPRPLERGCRKSRSIAEALVCRHWGWWSSDHSHSITALCVSRSGGH